MGVSGAIDRASAISGVARAIEIFSSAAGELQRELLNIGFKYCREEILVVPCP